MSKLLVDDLHVYYGTSHILQGVTMDIKEGDAVAYLGNNGAGKSTTFRAIMGLKEPRSGTINYENEPITDLEIHERARRGLAYVPGDRRLFGQLTVEENLITGHTISTVDRDEQLAFVYDLFPVLKERRRAKAAQLSGGQQQMVAIGRALINDPDLLLLDEPTEGLAPQIVDTVVNALTELKSQQYTMIVVEHDLSVAFSVCDRGYVLQRGEIALEGSIDEIKQDLREIAGFGGGS